MNIHEYQAKEVLRGFGVPVPKGKPAFTVEEAVAAGVFGSPFVIVDGEPFWGLDRFDQLERWLANGGF